MPNSVRTAATAAFERMHPGDAAEDRFQRGLERLLDGIELDLKRRGAL